MIIDLQKFVVEQPYWTALENVLDWIESPGRSMSIQEIERFHGLYQRASADLAKWDLWAVKRIASDTWKPGHAGLWRDPRDPENGPARSVRRMADAEFPQAFRRHRARFNWRWR